MRLGRILYLTLVSTIFATTVWGCTGIQLKAKDGSFVSGRTVEFSVPLDLSAIVVPRNYEFKGTLPDGSAGIQYLSKYAVVGVNAFGAPSVLDGVNEKGLVAALFYFPDYAGYTEIKSDNKNKALSPTEFTNWILTQFATVDEVKQNLNAVVIAPTAPNGWGGVPPFHYVVYDKAGKSIVIEPIKGELKVYDNPIGVITNSPTFDWHLTNLSNYINLSPLNAPSINVDGMKLQQFGQGSGLHGLPGDFTSPSRFIRVAIFSTVAVPSDNADQTVQQIFHILNQFDIPVGSVRSKDNNKVVDELTRATTVRDPQHLKYYFRTFDDQTIRMIDLNTFDLDAKALKTISMKGMTPVVDVSNTAK